MKFISLDSSLRFTGVAVGFVNILDDIDITSIHLIETKKTKLKQVRASSDTIDRARETYLFVKGLIEKENDFQLTLQKLKNEYVNRDDRKRHLGNWVDFAIREYEDYGYGKVKLATSSAINAYKLLFVDSESPYYIPEGIDPTMFDIHGSFTQIITDDKKDILTKFEKTIIIGKMLGLVK